MVLRRLSVRVVEVQSGAWLRFGAKWRTRLLRG
jgi:hypothetical protein